MRVKAPMARARSRPPAASSKESESFWSSEGSVLFESGCAPHAARRGGTLAEGKMTQTVHLRFVRKTRAVASWGSADKQDKVLLDASHRAAEVVISSRPIAKLEGKAQHPLTNWDTWKHVVDEVRCALGHPAPPSTKQIVPTDRTEVGSFVKTGTGFARDSVSRRPPAAAPNPPCHHPSNSRNR